MAKYRVGIFGVGDVAIQYANAVQSNPLTELVAAVSRDKIKTEGRLKNNGMDQVEVLNDYDELVSQKGLDIIVNTGPHQMHAIETIKAAEAGIHVMFEKPVGMNFKEVLDVYNTVKASGIKTQQGTPLIFNPYMKNLQKMIDDGHLGKLFYLQADHAHTLDHWPGLSWGGNKRKGGPSAPLVTGIHAVTALRRLGGEIEEVCGYQTWGHKKNYEYAPTFTAVLKFKSGAIGNISSTYEAESPYIRDFVIHGSKGSIRNDTFFLKELFPGQTDWQKFETTLPDSGAVSTHSFQDLWDDFIDAIDNDRPSAVNIVDTLKTHEICYAITESMEKGKIVKLPLSDYLHSPGAGPR